MPGFHVLRKLSTLAISLTKPVAVSHIKFSASTYLVCRKFSSESMARTQVFFDVAADKTPLGRIVMEVRIVILFLSF